MTKVPYRWELTLSSSFAELFTALTLSCSMNWLNKKIEAEPLRYAMTMVKRRGRFWRFFSPTKAVKQRGTWSEGEYRFTVPLIPSHPPLFPLPLLGYCPLSPYLPVFRLGLELFPMAANRIRSTPDSGHSLWIWECYCSLVGLWYFNYPATRGLQSGPAGNKLGAGGKASVFTWE